MFMDDAALHIAITSHYLDEATWSKAQREIIIDELHDAENGFKLRDEIIQAQDFKNKIDQAIAYLDNEIQFQQWRDNMKLPNIGHPLTLVHAFNEGKFERERMLEIKNKI
jgi:hypothetical protein